MPLGSKHVPKTQHSSLWTLLWVYTWICFYPHILYIHLVARPCPERNSKHLGAQRKPIWFCCCSRIKPAANRQWFLFLYIVYLFARTLQTHCLSAALIWITYYIGTIRCGVSACFWLRFDFVTRGAQGQTNMQGEKGFVQYVDMY